MFKRNEQNLMLICHFYEHHLWQKCQQLKLYVLFDTEEANFLLKWTELPFNHIFIFLMVEDPVLLQAYSQFTELKLKRRDNKHGFQYHFPHESCCFISMWVFYMTPTFMLQRSQSPTSMLSNLFLYYHMVKLFFETAYLKKLLYDIKYENWYCVITYSLHCQTKTASWTFRKAGKSKE